MSILNFFKGFAVTLGKLNHASESGEVVTTFTIAVKLQVNNARETCYTWFGA